MASMLEAALSWVEHGFKVIPVALNKQPLTAHGLKDCTQMKDGVRNYWGKWPDAGIGVVTDGLIVLDFDAAHGGLDSLEAITQKYGSFPDTRTHMTGGGGFHYIFRNPNGRNIRNTVGFGGYQGVDIRANGGYIVVPPSPHPSGKAYKVTDKSAIAPAPQWILDLCTERRQAAIADPGQDAIQEGQRDATLTSLAGTMRRRGMSVEAIEAALTAENIRRCHPPLSDKDIARIAASVSRYTPEPSATTTDPPDIDQALAEINKPNKPNIPNIPNKLNFLNISEHSEHFEGNPQAYKNISRLVEKWLPFHKGETFDLDTICRQLGVTDRDDRHRVVVRLFHAVEADLLKKDGRLYSYIDKTYKLVPWEMATGEDDTLDVTWPYGHEDGSAFGFADAVSVSQGDVVVLAGVSNMGKTAFCLNMVVDNMDRYSVTYMGNEIKPAKFARRINRMNWANPIDEEGRPKFETIERHEKWADIIRPDSINIIDWINLGDNFYQIGRIIEGIQERLKMGIAVISIQKSEGKTLGLGGGFSEHLSSLYLTFDFERLHVRKAKEIRPGRPNPNGKDYGFTIVDGGSKFHHIREIKKCRACGGTGQKKGADCDNCMGKGMVDA